MAGMRREPKSFSHRTQVGLISTETTRKAEKINLNLDI